MDGYRIRLMMVGQKTVLDTTNDTEAICLVSPTAGGALCAGVRYNGTTESQWAEWIPNNYWEASKDAAIQLSGGIDQTVDWFAMDEENLTTITVDGSDSSYWSIFKYQPLEATSYTNNYRFDSKLSDVTPYIYKSDEATSTYSYYAGTAMTLNGAQAGLSQIAAMVGAVATILISF